MLQPVIGNDDVHAESDQLSGSRETVACDHYLAPGQTREQQGLITHVPPGGFGMHAARLAAGAAIATGDDPNPQAGEAELLGEPRDQWGFAGASDRQVANHDDG